MNSKLRDILNDFRQQTIVIDNNNSLGGGERGAEAFRSSLDQAEKAIRQAVSEEMLAMFPPMWVITEQPDEYARQKALGYNQGLAELRQKIKEWQGGES